VRLSVADVLARLRAEGLATADADNAARSALRAELQDDLPWYLRMAVGVGAWTATGLFLAFLLTIANLDDERLRIVVGIALTAAAVGVRRTASSEFLRQAAVAASLAGQGLLLVGVHEMFDSVRFTAAAIILVSVALIWLVPDAIHRFLSTLAMVVALYVLVVDEKSQNAFELTTLALAAAVGFVWRYRVRDRGEFAAALLQPVGYALVTALFAALLLGSITHFGQTPIGNAHVLALGRLITIGITVGLVALVWAIIHEHGAALNSGKAFAALAGVMALGVGTLSTPGIVAGAAVLVLAFDRRDRVLLGMGVIFLLVFGSVYYYSMHITLLEKSGVLAGSGVLLLAVRNRMARP